MGNSFIRIQSKIQLLSIKMILNNLPNLGDPCGPAHKDYFINLMLLKFCILKHLVNSLCAFFEQSVAELFEETSGNCFFVRIIAEVVREDNLRGGGQLYLDLLAIGTQSPKGLRILAHVDLQLLLHLFTHILHHTAVEVLPS